MTLDRIRQAADIAFKTRGEELFFDDLVPDYYSDEDLARLYLVADEFRKAVDRVADIVGQEWVQRWRDRDRKGVEVDGFLVTTKKGYTAEKCIDSEGFWEWMNTQPATMVAAVFNENQARKGSLPPEARDTFFEKTYVIKPDSIRQPSAIPVEMLND